MARGLVQFDGGGGGAPSFGGKGGRFGGTPKKTFSGGGRKLPPKAPKTVRVPVRGGSRSVDFSRIAKVAPRSVAPKPAPSAPSSGRNTGVGSTATGTVAARTADPALATPVSVPEPEKPKMTEDEWLAQDSQFADDQANLEREYQTLLSQLARQRGDYELDINNSYKNLGWLGEDQGWAQDDRLTGYGQAFHNQLGDFASRGMLDSSLYGEALNDLNRNFNQQRDDLGSALQRFIQGVQEDTAEGKSARDAGLVSARRQALQRMAAALGSNIAV